MTCPPTPMGCQTVFSLWIPCWRVIFYCQRVVRFFLSTCVPESTSNVDTCSFRSVSTAHSSTAVFAVWYNTTNCFYSYLEGSLQLMCCRNGKLRISSSACWCQYTLPGLKAVFEVSWGKIVSRYCWKKNFLYSAFKYSKQHITERSGFFYDITDLIWTQP